MSPKETTLTQLPLRPRIKTKEKEDVSIANQRFYFKPRYGVSHALIIGIDKYKSVSPLSYAVSDASAIKDLLVENFNFHPDNVTYLANQQATRRAILGAMAKLGNNTDFDDRIIVFFAGHGQTLPGSRGDIGFLVPYDAEQGDHSTLIRWHELVDSTELIRAKHVLFIMDACYSGLALTRNAQAGSTRFLKDMLMRRARQVLTAGKADEQVADSGGPIPNHSVFTGHLIDGLNGNAATTDGVITANGLMAYVYAKVANDRNSEQTPHYGYFEGDGDLVLRAPRIDQIEGSEKEGVDVLIAVPYADEPVARDSLITKIGKAKSLLASEQGAIELHDLLLDEVRRFLSATVDDAFALSSPYSVDELIARIEGYERATDDLCLLLACVAHWAKPMHVATLQKCLARSTDRLDVQGGLNIWLAMRWYPLILELYTCGLAAVDAERYDMLAAVFYTKIPATDQQQESELFVEAVSRGMPDDNIFKRLPGHERQYVPMSEYLYKKLQPKLDDTFFIGKNYEDAFDTFEMLFALVVADIRTLKDRGTWGPIGRFGWKRRRWNDPLEKLVTQARQHKGEWPPLKAGMFGGSFERFDNVATAFMDRLKNIHWD